MTPARERKSHRRNIDLQHSALCLLNLIIGLLLLCIIQPLTAAEETENNARKTKPVLHLLRTETFGRQIEDIDISPGSDLAAVVLDDRAVKVWKLDRADLVHQFNFPGPQTTSFEIHAVVRFAPDGKSLAITSGSRIQFYDTGNWREIRSLSVPDDDQPQPVVPAQNGSGAIYEREFEALKVSDFRFTPDGSSILASSCRGVCYATHENVLRQWDVKSGTVKWSHILDPKKAIDRLSISHDGKLFAASIRGLGQMKIGIYRMDTGMEVNSLPEVRSPDAPILLFTSDNRNLITNPRKPKKPNEDPNSPLVSFNLESDEKAEDFPHKFSAGDADLSSDGKWLASTTLSGWAFGIWDMETHTLIMTKAPWEMTWVTMRQIRFTLDGRKLIVVSNRSGRVQVYDFKPRS